MPDENRITYFATTDARNRRVPFGIKAKDRTRHMYVIGKTGMGKSTLLENMAIQDIQNGEGFAFIDPHGKTAELLLEYVPEERIKDVLYFAPFDMEYPIAFNVMEDVGIDKRHLVVSGLMSAFKKIWVDAWSARMEYILSNTLLALLEYPGATLLAINKMLSDKDFRKKVVENITDPTVKSFWVDEFAKYTDRFAAEATPAIQNKVGQFTSNPLIRNIIGQPQSSFDLRRMMDERKILIINLSKGRVGEGNANLLGSMLITKIYLAAMSRADVPEARMARLPNFYLYVDEFQSFANESFADILSEARKYKLNLTVAHQYIEQMSEEVRAAIFGNVGTMIVFRVGPFDAEIFEKEFMPTFIAEDFVNLGFAQIYLKLMIDGVGSQPFSAITMPPVAKPVVSYKEEVLRTSREQFGEKRNIVEEDIIKQTLSTSVLPKIDKKEQKNDGKQHAASEQPKSEVKKTPIKKEDHETLAEIIEEKVKEVGSHLHLEGLRQTLADVVGVGVPEVLPQKEEVALHAKAPESSVEKEERPTVSKKEGEATRERRDHASQESRKEISVKKQDTSKRSNTNSANRAALAAVLASLKKKEDEEDVDGRDSEEEGGVYTAPAPDMVREAKREVPEIPEDELRAMLHVDSNETR